MNLIERATIIHYHRRRLQESRAGWLSAMGWRTPDSQRRRFEAFLRLGDFSGRSLMDVGCGCGDLKAHLDQSFREFTYMGIDHMPEFIDEAARRYGDHPDTHFFLADFTRAELPRADFVIASGALAYRCGDRQFPFEMIRKLFESARIALGFNMLDAAVFPDHPLLVGHDRAEITAFCRGLCGRVELIDGYAVDDYTLLLYRD